MASVTIPFWLTIAVAAVAAFLSILMIWRRVHRRTSHPAVQTDPHCTGASWPGFNGQIHQQALVQQIDAVFNALTAVIESERIKLKILAEHACGSLPAMHQSSGTAGLGTIFNNAPDESNGDIGRSIVACAQQGLKPDDIARRFGVSGAEVSLAMKMHREAPGHKLEAVA